MNQTEQTPPTPDRDETALRAAFRELEAQKLARRWLLFAPVTAVLLALTEVAPFFSPEFPSAPFLTGSVILALGVVYAIARWWPRRALIGWATAVIGTIGGGYAASASALTGHFISPHSLAMAVVIALLPGVLAVSVAEALATMVGAIVAWVLVNLTWAGGTHDYSGLTTCLVYLSFLALVTSLSVLRNRELRYSEFAARHELERMHRFTVEEVLFRHLPAPYVEQVLSGARTVDQAPERRLVTVVFADMVGFSRVTEAMNPEALAAMLARFYDLISTVAARHDATMDKFMGDAAMAFFGAPDAMAAQEQAQRALQMAIEWQRGMPDLHKGRARLTLRIGIHQEIVTVGSFGGRVRTDYTVLGSGVNLAARLQKLCAPGRILVTQAVKDLLDGVYPTTDLGAQELRGLTAPVQVYEIDPEAGTAVDPGGSE